MENSQNFATVLTGQTKKKSLQNFIILHRDQNVFISHQFFN